VKLDAEFGQTFVFSTPVALTAGRHSGTLMDEYSRAYPGAYRVRGEEKKNAAKVVIQQRNENTVAQEHPGIMTVNFEILEP